MGFPLNLKNMLGPHTVLALLFIAVALDVAALQIYIQIDNVVNVDLYRFGLQFNYIWALGYWNCYRLAMFCLLGAGVLMGFTLVPYYVYSRENTTASRWSCILFPLISAGFAGVSLYLILQVDSIVNVTLYQFGLQFSLDWASGYWSTTRLVLDLVGTAFIIPFVMALITWEITRE
jgi:hypothetical protein